MNVCKEDIFRRIFEKWSGSLRSFIAYRAKDVHVAEDVVQDAFHTLWVNCEKVSPEKAKSYLFTVAQNSYLNLAKRQGRQREFLSTQKDRQSTDPQFIMEMKEFESKLMNGIESLPDDVRAIFLMNRIDKLKYREIADILELSVKTIEKKMHLALVELRKIHPKV